jgi:hypothetical protein
MLRGAAPGVAAFGDLLDDLGGEGVEVAGLRGDDALIGSARAPMKTMRCQRRRKMISPPRAFSAG